MTAPSESVDLTALAALGDHLRAAGAPVVAEPTPRPYAPADVSAALTRLRAAVAGECLPATADLTVEQLAAYATRYAPRNAQRSLGRTGGYDQPQCAGCRAFIKHVGAQCSACGFMDGGGYLAVPAKTSHLERWR